MKLVIVAVALVFTLADTACHIPAPAFDIGVCTAGKLGPKIVEVKPRVLNCLKESDYGSCLAGIAKDLGIDVGKSIVICAVREFTGMGATPTTNPDVRERARAYLDANGVDK